MGRTVRIEHTSLFTRTLNSDAKIIIHEGGSSSSKTFSLAQIYMHIATQEKGKTLSCVRASLPWMKKGALKDFNEALDLSDMRSLFHENKTDIYFRAKNTGSRVEFFGLDEPEKAKGPRRDYLWINEATEISHDTYTQLALRTREKIFIDYNPSLIEFWVDEIMKRDDAEVIYSTYKDNVFLTPEMIREIEVLVPMYRLPDGSMFTDWGLEIEEMISEEKKAGNHFYSAAELIAGDAYKWAVYGLGRRGSPEEAIYPIVYDSEGLPDGERVYGLDFGWNDPMVLVEIARKDVYPKPELHIDQLIHESFLTVKDLIDLFPDLGVKKDQIIYADGARPEMIEEIKRAGYWIVGADKSKGSVYAGINYVKTYKLCFTSRSHKSKVEHRNYRWKKKPDGTILDEPVDKDNHSPDGVRYGTFTHWGKGMPCLVATW